MPRHNLEFGCIGAPITPLNGTPYADRSGAVSERVARYSSTPVGCSNPGLDQARISPTQLPCVGVEGTCADQLASTTSVSNAAGGGHHARQTQTHEQSVSPTQTARGNNPLSKIISHPSLCRGSGVVKRSGCVRLDRINSSTLGGMCLEPLSAESQYPTQTLSVVLKFDASSEGHGLCLYTNFGILKPNPARVSAQYEVYPRGMGDKGDLWACWGLSFGTFWRSPNESDGACTCHALGEIKYSVRRCARRSCDRATVARRGSRSND